MVSTAATKAKAKTASRARGRATTEIIHDPHKPVRPYALSERFGVGEQIQHKKFGPGVVCGVEDDKIRVNFNEGTKVLLHGRVLSPSS